KKKDLDHGFVIAKVKLPTTTVARGSSWLGGPVIARALLILVPLFALSVWANQFIRPVPKIQSSVATIVQGHRETEDTRPAVPLHLPVVATQLGSAFPRPTVYGVYALSDGQLYELEALPGRVPDPKVFMSTPVKKASHTKLPDGRLAFVVYRRDIAASAPDRVQIRVIAKIARAMTFDSGQANTTSLDDQWTIRGNFYELRVAPVPENAEMLLIRSENLDFALPAGRYGLVLKGIAYDFVVDGPVTEATQCL